MKKKTKIAQIGRKLTDAQKLQRIYLSRLLDAKETYKNAAREYYAIQKEVKENAKLIVSLKENYKIEQNKMS